MARDHGRVRHGIWSNRDFLALPERAQRAFMLALSQPDMSFAGVVPFTLRRWARLSADSTPESLREALAVLEGSPAFVVVDEDTEELLVRSFMRNDGILESPNMAKASVKAFHDIHSARLREVWLQELRRLAEEVPRPGHPKVWQESLGTLLPDLPEPLQEGFPKGLGEGFPESRGTLQGTFREGVSSRARVARAAPALAPALAPTPAAAMEPSPQPPQEALDPALVILRGALSAARLDVGFDKLTDDQAAEVVHLVGVHGDAALVRTAVQAYRPDNPAQYVNAYLAKWRALPKPGDRLRAVPDTCAEHRLEQPCRSCAADRKAGGDR